MPHTAPGVGKGLDRRTIIAAALDLIDQQGAQGITMRGLGQHLGVEAMALYRYVSGREDLLEAVVAHILEGLHRTVDEQLAETWQGYLQSLAHQVRRIAVEHPAAFPLVATRHPAAEWLRPPLRSLELVEHFLATLLGHGFSDAQVAATYRAFSSFLLGHLLLEASIRDAATSPVEIVLDEGGADLPHSDGRLDLDRFTHSASSKPCSAKITVKKSSRSPSKPCSTDSSCRSASSSQ